jgi:DNA-binding Lrp family transcriptional regulator
VYIACIKIDNPATVDYTLNFANLVGWKSEGKNEKVAWWGYANGKDNNHVSQNAVSVTLSEANKYPEVIEAFKKISEVVECHFVTGRHNLLIKIFCFDHDHLMQILLNTIQKIPYVMQTETQISLDQAIERQVWVKEYQNTSFSASVKKHKEAKKKEKEREKAKEQE